MAVNGWAASYTGCGVLLHGHRAGQRNHGLRKGADIARRAVLNEKAEQRESSRFWGCFHRGGS